MEERKKLRKIQEIKKDILKKSKNRKRRYQKIKREISKNQKQKFQK